MAEDQERDDSQKTEEPTPKRLREARENGQIARSQEISHWFMILAFAVIVGFFGQGLAGGIGEVMLPFIARPHAIAIGEHEVGVLLRNAAAGIAAVFLVPVAIAVLAALLSGLLQTGAVLSLEPIKPKLSKISLASGCKRLFSTRALAEFAKGLFKIAVVSVAVVLVIYPERELIPHVPSMTMAALLDTVQSLGLRLLMAVIAVMTVIAALDYLYQHHKHIKQLRMTRQELKDEYKQTEGDPTIKARLRQIRTERARQRMMAAVPEADVVITNPTHFSVALRYDRLKNSAPEVVAKGVDHMALRIREFAKEHDVTLMEDPPLARAIYRAVKVGQEIPEKFYQAVATVLGHVYRLKGNVA
jgi:flagellar biosynthetic protein FlhB